MPHAHCLITLHKDHLLDTPEKAQRMPANVQVDKVVWARLPKLPSREDPDYETMAKLRKLVCI